MIKINSITLDSQWEMLIKAYEDECWYTRAKYKKETFDYMIAKLPVI